MSGGEGIHLKDYVTWWPTVLSVVRVDSYKGNSVATLEEIFQEILKNLLTNSKFYGIINIQGKGNQTLK